MFSQFSCEGLIKVTDRVKILILSKSCLRMPLTVIPPLAENRPQEDVHDSHLGEESVSKHMQTQCISPWSIQRFAPMRRSSKMAAGCGKLVISESFRASLSRVVNVCGSVVLPSAV